MKRMAVARCGAIALSCGLLLFTPAAAGAAPLPPETTTPGLPAEPVTPGVEPLTPSAPLVPIPPGCPTPAPATLIFVGRMIARDATTARFQVEQVRAGLGEHFVISGLVDVRYDDDLQYLTVRDRYLVGAARSTVGLGLVSKVDVERAVFGGDAVIGVSDGEVECPALEDPVRTLHVDGTAIDSGMFHTIARSKRDLVMAVATPVLAAFAIVIGLVMIRWLFTAFFASVRNASHAADYGDDSAG